MIWGHDRKRINMVAGVFDLCKLDALHIIRVKINLNTYHVVHSPTTESVTPYINPVNHQIGTELKSVINKPFHKSQKRSAVSLYEKKMYKGHIKHIPSNIRYLT